MIIKTGYHNKIIKHGDESVHMIIKTLKVLFHDNNPSIQQQMRNILNNRDKQGNTALHYTKLYPDQSIASFLLEQGAKIDLNPQAQVNINPK